MASPASETTSKGKKKGGKQAKSAEPTKAETEESGSLQSTATDPKSATATGSHGKATCSDKSGPANQTADSGSVQAQAESGPKKDKQQKKQEKQSKSPKSKPEASKPPEGSGGAEAGGGGEGEPPKSKAQLKAERRALQEKQRALKEAKKAEAAGGPVASSGTAAPSATDAGSKPGSDPSKAASALHKTPQRPPKTEKSKKSSKDDFHSLSEEQQWVMKEREMLTKGSKLDDSISNLGLQYFHQRIVGADARCVALLTALKEVIGRYRTPEEKELSRDLEKNLLAPCIKFISDCRPLSTSMGNAIKFLKQQVSQIPQGTEDSVAISTLHEAIDNFIYDNILKATEAVAHYATLKIDDGDVILVYAASSLIAQVLKFAHGKGKQFRVIVVEGRPRTEGKTMLRYLVRCGIPCSYIYIGSASHAMRETTKVFLGAAAMFAIGDMHSRTGNAMIAALAKANNIPVLVCCKTYKFTDKVQLTSGISSQKARGSDLISIGHRSPIIPKYEELDLHLLNIMYDVTESRYITALVTELGMLPCTSVPVVLRRQEDRIA